MDKQDELIVGFGFFGENADKNDQKKMLALAITHPVHLPFHTVVMNTPM